MDIFLVSEISALDLDKPGKLDITKSIRQNISKIISKISTKTLKKFKAIVNLFSHEKRDLTSAEKY